MSDIKWIKITTDIFDDEKILLIESMPDADAIIVIWFKLLVLAGKTNNCGLLTINDTIPYNDEMLATIFRRPVNTVRLALDVFEQFGMIDIINDTICIPKWEIHQNIEGLDKIREQNRERKRRQREREKQLLLESDMSRDSSREVTQQNKNKKEDKDKDKEKEHSISSSILSEEFESLWQLYPKKQGKQSAYKSYEKARKDGVAYEEVENGIKAYSEYVKGKDPQYIKMGSSFFNQRAWQDDWSIKNGHTKFDEYDNGADQSGVEPDGWDTIFGA